MSSIKITNSAPVEISISSQDATYTAAHRPSDDWGEPAPAITLQPGTSATLALTPIRRLIVETSSTAEVAVALNNQERVNTIRVATQAKRGKGYDKPAHSLFLQPTHPPQAFGRAPEGSPEASVGLSAAKRLILTLLPS